MEAERYTYSQCAKYQYSMEWLLSNQITWSQLIAVYLAYHLGEVPTMEKLLTIGCRNLQEKGSRN